MCREVPPSLYTWSPIPKVTPPSILTCTLRSPLVAHLHPGTLPHPVAYTHLSHPVLSAAAHLMEQSRSFTGVVLP